ncbi:hypothetical protein [Actinomadura miaoliensis]|uniref:Uncharacterized protein n=1 Tax=Actinomadura miaoliensis TaxID=430685 RepID=A0ABP7V857_9ACTN
MTQIGAAHRETLDSVDPAALPLPEMSDRMVALILAFDVAKGQLPDSGTGVVPLMLREAASDLAAGQGG